MKAKKAKRDSAKSSSGYTVVGAKEDYDLDKVLADLGEVKSNPKGQKAAGSGSGKKKSSQVKTHAEKQATPLSMSQQQQQPVCSLTQFFSACIAGLAWFTFTLSSFCTITTYLDAD